MTTITPSLPGLGPLGQQPQQPLAREPSGGGARGLEPDAQAAPAPPADQVAAEARPVPSADEVFAALEAGADAGLDGDGARLLALSLQQSLQGVEAAIANTRPNSVLGLLRA